VAPLQKRHGRATVRYLVRYLWRDVFEEACREFGSGQMLYQWNTPIAPLLDDDEQDKALKKQAARAQLVAQRSADAFVAEQMSTLAQAFRAPGISAGLVYWRKYQIGEISNISARPYQPSPSDS